MENNSSSSMLWIAVILMGIFIWNQSGKISSLETSLDSTNSAVNRSYNLADDAYSLAQEAQDQADDAYSRADDACYDLGC